MLTRRDLIKQAGAAGALLLTHSAAGKPTPLQADPGAIKGPVSLRAHAATQGRLYGSAVDVHLLQTDPAYRQLLVDQCSIVVAENAMKWGGLRPGPEQFRFDEADTFVAFAQQHSLKIRGHNLCWHESLPPWVEATVTPQNAAHYFTEHIRTVAGRYKGRIRAWDVVNEAILPKDGRPDGLRDSPWLRLLGPGYVDLAFRTARQADPHALLTYNDFNIEYDHADNADKRAAVLAMLRRLKASGTPIDAVGVQSHLTAGSPNPLGPGLLAFTAEIHALGLQVFVTELDVNDDEVTADDETTRDTAVADVYRTYVSTLLTSPAVTDVLTWGLSDNHSWLNNSKAHKEKHSSRPERALPFNTAYQPKPACYALQQALATRSAKA